MINEASSGGVATAKRNDRDTKIAYVEQIRAGKLTAIEAARELGLHESTIYRWLKKYSEDGENAFPGSGRMRPDLEYVKRLEREQTAKE
jgi:transposase